VSYRADGQQTITQRYCPWGTIRSGSDNALPTDYTFTGQKLDESTGLMYYGARYYDASLGRFVQADTIVPNPGNPQSLNRYSYVYNNPLAYVDDDGHFALLVTAIGGAIAGAVVSSALQVAHNLQQGQSLGEAVLNVDPGKVAGAAVGGAVMGATLGLAAPAGLGATLAAGTVGGVLGGQAGRAAEAREFQENNHPKRH
jgi:RHS repeat-associated protein